MHLVDELITLCNSALYATTEYREVTEVSFRFIMEPSDYNM